MDKQVKLVKVFDRKEFIKRKLKECISLNEIAEFLGVTEEELKKEIENENKSN